MQRTQTKAQLPSHHSMMLSGQFQYAGRADESIAQSEYAIRLNPKDPSIFFRYTSLSIAHFTQENYEDALKWAAMAIDRKPNYWIPRALQAASLILLGRVEEAKDASRALKEVFPEITLTSLPLEPIRPPEAKKRFYRSLAQTGIPE